MDRELPDKLKTPDQRARQQEDRRVLRALKKARRVRSNRGQPAGALLIFYGGDGALHIRTFKNLYED